jgi:hypothetical protein
VLIYSLGIVIDRLSDQLFSKQDKKLRSNIFSNNSEYHFARTYVYTYGTSQIINLFEYGRSRIRISRAWFINYLMLMISIPIFIWTRFPNIQLNLRIQITFFGIIVLGLCSIATLVAWGKLVENDYKRLTETYEFIKAEKK